MGKSLRKTFSEILDKRENEITAEDVAEMSFRELIAYKTCKKMTLKGSMNDALALGKLLGEVDDNKVVITPIDQALEDAKANN